MILIENKNKNNRCDSWVGGCGMKNIAIRWRCIMGSNKTDVCGRSVNNWEKSCSHQDKKLPEYKKVKR